MSTARGRIISRRILNVGRDRTPSLRIDTTKFTAFPYRLSLCHLLHRFGVLLVSFVIGTDESKKGRHHKNCRNIIMRRIPIALSITITLLLLVPAGLGAQEMPDWVKKFVSGEDVALVISRTGNIYYGVGKSKSSQAEADELARQDFARMLNTSIVEEMELRQEEDNDTFRERYDRQLKQKSQATIRGININYRFEDAESGVYYALIYVNKDEFDRRQSEELRREAKRIRDEIAAERQRQELEFEKEKEEQRLKAEKKEQKESLRRECVGLYREYLELAAPVRTVKSATAQNTSMAALKGGVVPLGLGQLYASYALWKLQPFVQGSFRDQLDLNNYEAGVRFQVAEEIGELAQASVALGFLAHGVLEDSLDLFSADQFVEERFFMSPQLVVGFNMPQIIHSYHTISIDSRTFTYAINARPFFSSGGFGEKFEVVAQLDAWMKKAYYFSEKEALLTHFGFRFYQSESMQTLISVENFRAIRFGLEFQLGKEK